MKLIDVKNINWRTDEDSWVSYITADDIRMIEPVNPVHAAGACYCRECINFTQIDFNWGLCRHHDSDMEVNGFCSCGKLKGVYDGESD